MLGQNFIIDKHVAFIQNNLNKFSFQNYTVHSLAKSWWKRTSRCIQNYAGSLSFSSSFILYKVAGRSGVPLCKWAHLSHEEHCFCCIREPWKEPSFRMTFLNSEFTGFRRQNYSSPTAVHQFTHPTTYFGLANGLCLRVTRGEQSITWYNQLTNNSHILLSRVAFLLPCHLTLSNYQCWIPWPYTIRGILRVLWLDDRWKVKDPTGSSPQGTQEAVWTDVHHRASLKNVDQNCQHKSYKAVKQSQVCNTALLKPQCAKWAIKRTIIIIPTRNCPRKQG